MVLCISGDVLNAALIILYSLIVYMHTYTPLYSFLHTPPYVFGFNCTTDSSPAFAFQTHACELQVLYALNQSKPCYSQNYCLSFLGSKDVLSWCVSLTIMYRMLSRE